ncbi:hypothetical protein [Paenibacillus ginsengihumi]|jgi:ABC-type glycerol-3-phosphate transport system substrate-binding protein|uniref:hypothetical protein n=1 Tax=Paenibacillus ginsengihumi TaxID=431596 RepID=UPI00036D11B3|nr:hypothetical protein [Paenibacillus ginsengihumi]
MKGKLLLMALLLAFSVLTGCSKGPKADVTLFLMASNGVPNEVGEKLQQSLQAKVGEGMTVEVVTTPIFSLEKLIVEIAAGGHGVLIVPGEQFKALGQQGGYVSLDDVANPEDYPEGVLEMTEDGKTEKHLYGIPLEHSRWFADLQLNGKDLFAFIPLNAPDHEKAKQVMKIIAEKKQD